MDRYDVGMMVQHQSDKQPLPMPWLHPSRGFFIGRRMELTHSELTRLLSYDPSTGHFVWLEKPSIKATKVKVGCLAGFDNSRGYKEITINQSRYLCHRLAWFYVYKIWPSKDLDHINRVRSDNRIANLREATPSENCHNTGVHKGCVKTKHGTWQARIGIDNQKVYLGNYKSEHEAHLAYLEAKKTFHPTSPVNDLNNTHSLI